MSKKMRKKTDNPRITSTLRSKTAATRTKSTATPPASAAAKSHKPVSRSARQPTARAAHTSSGALAEGDRVPSFQLPRDGGQSVSLADFAGRKLVIFFYPRADTPGCTLEAGDFSRLA
jgi:peroxiredoxin Q/BCP